MICANPAQIAQEVSTWFLTPGGHLLQFPNKQMPNLYRPLGAVAGGKCCFAV
jgi:hypothetical protein